MRQNAASLVELAYKKSAFLVEGIKKSFEAELANEKDAAEVRRRLLRNECKAISRTWRTSNKIYRR